VVLDLFRQLCSVVDTYIEILTNKDEAHIRYDKRTDENGSRSIAFIIW